MARMSSAASWAYTATATFWPRLGRDAWSGVETFGSPVQIACDYSAKAERVTDAKGVEFVARALIYTERSDIKQGDRILIGSSIVSTPIAAGAMEVRAVDRFGDTLERKADDFRVAC